MAAPTTGYDLTQVHPIGWCIPDPLPNDGEYYQPFTVEHWLYLESLPDNAGILTAMVPESAWSDAGLNLYLRSQSGAGYAFTVSGSYTRAGTPPIGQWTHVAWVYTGTTIKIYENGQEIGNTSRSSIPVECQFLHARFNNTEQQTINGKVARLRFWNKALTTTEVAAAKDATYDASEPDLIVQYELDDPAPEVFAKPDRPFHNALLLNRDAANADNLVANRMGYIYTALAHERPKQTEISGIVTDANGQPCQRKVYAVTRPIDGALPEVLAHGLSDPATGEYTLDIPTTAEVSRVVVSEDDDSPLLNDLIDRIIPT